MPVVARKHVIVQHEVLRARLGDPLEPAWEIEPLLTVKELSSILRLPVAAVRGLGIKSVRIGGEERFRQSTVRAYLIEQETQTIRPSIAAFVTSPTHTQSEDRTHPQARRFKSFYNRDR